MGQQHMVDLQALADLRKVMMVNRLKDKKSVVTANRAISGNAADASVSITNNHRRQRCLSGKGGDSSLLCDDMLAAAIEATDWLDSTADDVNAGGAAAAAAADDTGSVASATSDELVAAMDEIKDASNIAAGRSFMDKQIGRAHV